MDYTAYVCGALEFVSQTTRILLTYQLPTKYIYIEQYTYSQTALRYSMRIEVKRKLCIGAATCVTVAPKTFVIDDEIIVIVKDKLGDDADTILEAARVCPTLAIYIYDDNRPVPELKPARIS